MSGDKIWSMPFRGREVAGFMGKDAFRRLKMLIEEHEVKTVLELGAFVGMSTCWFAEHVEQVTTIDNFDVYSQEYPDYMHTDEHRRAAQAQFSIFLDNIEPYDNIEYIVGEFMDVIEVAPQADLVFIDAVQPTYPEIVRAYLPKARKIICGDDASAPAVREAIAQLNAKGPEVLSRLWWKIL